jgi:hypothetical protein
VKTLEIKEQTTTVDVSSLAKGIYFVRVKGEGGNFSQKIVVQ